MEGKTTELLGETGTDIRAMPFTREIVALPKRLMYNGVPIPFFSYYHEDHDELLAKLQICEPYGAIYDVRRNDGPRWNFTEDFAEYMLGIESSTLTVTRSTVAC